MLRKLALHAHERGVVVGRQHAVALDDDRRRLAAASPDDPEDGVRQDRLARRDGREPGDLDQRSRAARACGCSVSMRAPPVPSST